jgi:hypothetical protein
VAQALECVGLNQQGRAARLVSVVFRQQQCGLSNDASSLRLSAFFVWLGHLTLVAGDFLPGFRECAARAGP